MSRWSLGVDVGGTKILVAAVDEAGKVSAKERIATRVVEGARMIIDDLSALISATVEKVGSAPAGIGLGIPGQVDTMAGIVHFAPNLSWHDVPLQAMLSERFTFPIRLLNDVRAATLGEWKYGAGRGSDQIVCLFVGTGVGGGIVAKGALVDGITNCAGELGHLIIDINGPPCTCGGWGCLESYASGWAIAKQGKNMLLHHPEAHSLMESLHKQLGGEFTAEVVIKAYRQNDLLAKQVIDRAVQGLIAGTVSIANSLNPERLIFGGGIIEALPEIIERVNFGLRERALPIASQKLQLLPSQLGSDAGVLGAATYFLS
jgi:glucokinase